MERLVKISGHKPWLSPFYGESAEKDIDFKQKDDSAKIDRCLSCPFPKCIDCIGERSAKYDRFQLYMMILQNKRTSLIAKALGITEKTVRAAKEEAWRTW